MSDGGAAGAAAERAEALAGRLRQVWGVLPAERRTAALASIGLFLTMFLPWYQQNAVAGVGHGLKLASGDLSAFGVFSFVEASVLVVAAGVLVLLYARAQSRAFHLPGGDGTIVMVAGGWALVLLVWRLFDKPGINTSGNVAANVGIQWGIFFALGAAGLLTYAGSRMRAAHRPEPPLLIETDPTPVAPTPLGTETTEPLHDPEPEPATVRLRDERPLRRRRTVDPFADDPPLTMPLGSEPPLPRDDLTEELDGGEPAPRRRHRH